MGKSTPNSREYNMLVTWEDDLGEDIFCSTY
jgi:hypothetical protein